MSTKSFLRHPGLGSLYSYLKYFSDWRNHNNPGRNSVADKSAWINFSSIDFLKKISSSEMYVFEYGSGGSTLFWASRVKQVISVEHDQIWFEKMQAELTRQKITNVDYFLEVAQKDQNFSLKNIQNPGDYISDDESYYGMSFEKYVKTIDRYPASYFDIIIVDGRARPSCIQHAIEKLKPKGYLVIDNTEREYYLASFHFEKREWKVVNFEGPVPYQYHFSQTSIIQKESSTREE